MAEGHDIEVARVALGRTRVYLDTKFWIYLRDALLGKPGPDSHTQLLAILQEVVEAGTHVCPLEFTLFAELMKQGNADLRIASARLMDRLSLGVVLKPFQTRVQAEVLRYLYVRFKPGAPLHTMDELVWTHPAYMLGRMVPVPRNVPPETVRLIQERFDAAIRRFGIEGILTTAGPDIEWPVPDSTELAAFINTQNAANASEVRSATHTYEVELRGAFEAFKSSVVEGALYFVRQQADPDAALGQITDAARGRALHVFLADEALAGDGAAHFPTFRTMTALYARVRWDRGRQYKPNDFDDFQHAAAALPYCDVFLTERSLAALINQGPRTLAEEMNVRVLATPEDAIQLLSIAKCS
jgi:hypothetical protein